MHISSCKMIIDAATLNYYRISFSSLTQVAFGNKFFSFIYVQRDEERAIVDKKTTAYVFNHTLAKSLFRTVTEDQVFHYQNTVTPMVMNHADTRETIWQLFSRKVYIWPASKIVLSILLWQGKDDFLFAGFEKKV